MLRAPVDPENNTVYDLCPKNWNPWVFFGYLLWSIIASLFLIQTLTE